MVGLRKKPMGVALNKAALVRQEVVSPVCCLVKGPVQRWAGFIQQEPWIDAKVCAGLVLDRWTTLEHQEIRAVGVPLCLLAQSRRCRGQACQERLNVLRRGGGVLKVSRGKQKGIAGVVHVGFDV